MRLERLMKHNTLFKARLRNLLLYYIRTRQAEGDYERLVNVQVSDRLKEYLIAPALSYVLNLEGDAFFGPDSVAMLADTYANNYQDANIRVTKLLSWMPSLKITQVKRVYGIVGTTRVRYKQRVQ